LCELLELYNKEFFVENHFIELAKYGVLLEGVFHFLAKSAHDVVLEGHLFKDAVVLFELVSQSDLLEVVMVHAFSSNEVDVYLVDVLGVGLPLGVLWLHLAPQYTQHQILEEHGDEQVQRNLDADGQVVVGLVLEPSPDFDSRYHQLQPRSGSEGRLEELGGGAELDSVDLLARQFPLEVVVFELVLAVDGPVWVAFALLFLELLDVLNNREFGREV